MSSTLITSYVNPDLDGVAGATAYAELLRQSDRDVEAAFIGEPHEEAQYVFDRFQLPLPRIIPNADGFATVILVDASDLTGLEGKIPPEKVTEIIDHRKVHEADKFPNAKVQIELVGAAATLITEKFLKENKDIAKASAILLASAIISNTLNFKGSNVTERDKIAAAWLREKVELPENFWKDLFLAKSDLTGDKLQKRILDDAAWFTFGDKQVGIAQIEMIGTDALLRERKNEIADELQQLQKERQLDYMFLNLIELENTKTYFVTSDMATQQLLTRIFTIRFKDGCAEMPTMMMRKQIVPLLKEILEK